MVVPLWEVFLFCSLPWVNLKYFLPYVGSWIRADASSFLETIVDLVRLPNSQNLWAHYPVPVLSEEITTSTIPFEGLPYAFIPLFLFPEVTSLFFLLLQPLFLLLFTLFLLFSPLCACPPLLPLDAWKINQWEACMRHPGVLLPSSSPELQGQANCKPSLYQMFCLLSS